MKSRGTFWKDGGLVVCGSAGDARMLSMANRKEYASELKNLKSLIDLARLLKMDTTSHTMKLGTPGMYVDVPELIAGVGTELSKEKA